MAEQDYALTTEDALGRLEVLPDYDAGNGPEPCVHTFVDAGFGLIGAHWSLGSVRVAFEEFGAQEAGDQATEMGHGVVVVRPDVGPVFFATRSANA